MPPGIRQSLDVLLCQDSSVRVAGRWLLFQEGSGDTVEAVAGQRSRVDVLAIYVM